MNSIYKVYPEIAESLENQEQNHQVKNREKGRKRFFFRSSSFQKNNEKENRIRDKIADQKPDMQVQKKLKFDWIELYLYFVIVGSVILIAVLKISQW